jgi:hypothetical protein
MGGVETLRCNTRHRTGNGVTQIQPSGSEEDLSEASRRLQQLTETTSETVGDTQHEQLESR